MYDTGNTAMPAVRVNHPTSIVFISIRLEMIRQTTNTTVSSKNGTVTVALAPEAGADVSPAGEVHEMFSFIFLVFYEVASTRMDDKELFKSQPGPLFHISAGCAKRRERREEREVKGNEMGGQILTFAMIGKWSDGVRARYFCNTISFGASLASEATTVSPSTER